MIEPSKTGDRPSAARVALTLTVLLAGLVPLPIGWARSARDAARSQDPDRADRQAGAGGYYESLIAGDAATRRGEPTPLEVALIGKPIDRNRDLVRRITRDLKDDFLQFEPRPGLDETFFGARFTTNAAGMRDRDYPVEKPPGVRRIALLGSSIDMGWGVATPDTYENRLEDWLNAEAARLGRPERVEILNFSMAAYGPGQRYEAFHRKALAYRPDAILYSATMLDPRLLEIHLGGLIRNRVDLKYDFFRRAAAAAGIDPDRERRDGWAALDRQGGFRARAKGHYWAFADATLGALAADARSLGLPLALVLIPRACRDDDDPARAAATAHHQAIAARHAVPVLDLSPTFDHHPPAAVEVAPGDDHPNTLGHRLLFEALKAALDADPAAAGTMRGGSIGPG